MGHLSRQDMKGVTRFPPLSFYSIFASFFLVLVMMSMPVQNVSAGDLDAYVQAKEKVYNWKVKEKRNIPGAGTGYHLKLVSQKWRGMKWKHNLRIVFPAEASRTLPAYLLITGGDGGWTWMNLAGQVASSTGYAIAVLHNIPNQPLFGGLREDALIAHTLEKYIDSGEESWPLLLPMTKAAVKAMDAVEEFSKQKLNRTIDGFVVGGASKRGWTTWLTAAVDDRTKGITPMVFDNLHFVRQLKNQKRVWDSFSEKIHDYTDRNLHKKLQSERGKKLMKMIDPYYFRDRITMPKLIFSGTNDGYWPVNSINLFYPALKAEKYIYYGPNAGHGLGNNFLRVLSTLKAFLARVRGKLSFPDFSSEFNRKEQPVFSFASESEPVPERIILWRAHSKNGDFRSSTWKPKLIGKGKKTVKKKLKFDKKGYVGLFGQIFYNIDGHKFSLSTQLYRVPIETK